MRPVEPFATHPSGARVAPTTRTSIGTLVAAAVLSLGLCPAALAAAPAPCHGIVQISDATGDGHHANTDVTAAWFSEQAGRLQAVVEVRLGDWAPAHDDSAAAAVALIFEVAGQTRYVRVETPRRPAAIRYDFGTWTPAGGFASSGATTGEAVDGVTTATIDVPAATGAVAGAVLVRPFVMTYDGAGSPADPHWVDRAPGGVTPTEAAFGADYVVGACSAGATGGPAPGAIGAGRAPGASATTAVVLDAPKRRTGAGRVRVGGRILPARGAITVRVVAKASHAREVALVRSVRTLTDGSYAVTLPLAETTAITAAAEGINAQTRTVTVRSTVRLTLRRVRGAKTVVSGLVSPGLPGRVLLLRADAVAPSATAIARGGRFRLAPRRLVRGR